MVVDAIKNLRRRAVESVFGLAPSRVMVRRGNGRGKRIALTFDDGPLEMTPRYLDTLGELGVYATFFVNGDNCVLRRDQLLEYVRRGHHVAGHGYSHLKFTDLSRIDLLTELAKTEEQLPPAPTRRPWVRPPYGALSPQSLAVVLAAGYTVALWSFDSQDYDVHDPDALVANCSPANVRPGDVMLFHEGHEWTLKALPRIVANLREAGYAFVTMAELVEG
jgi:peptidoglycan/xylan/chitin deacetylase (PgdA/CDA1 family)